MRADDLAPWAPQSRLRVLCYLTIGRAKTNAIKNQMQKIPDLDTDGLLPPGVFDCSFNELSLRFGSFQGSDRRLFLLQRLAALVAAMQLSGIFEGLVIDGSFVTAKPAPNDRYRFDRRAAARTRF